MLIRYRRNQKECDISEVFGPGLIFFGFILLFMTLPSLLVCQRFVIM